LSAHDLAVFVFSETGKVLPVVASASGIDFKNGVYAFSWYAYRGWEPAADYYALPYPRDGPAAVPQINYAHFD
jgi:hypothetical protein